jgi:hypothetical protein
LSLENPQQDHSYHRPGTECIPLREGRTDRQIRDSRQKIGGTHHFVPVDDAVQLPGMDKIE